MFATLKSTTIEREQGHEDVAWSSRDDVSLMGAVARGDVAAFQELLDRHMTAVYHFCFSILRDSCAAEDVTQETCVTVWRQAGRWSPEGKLRSWIFRIAHNLCIDEIRRRRPHADIDLFAESLADDTQTPTLRHIEETESSRMIKDALYELPVRQRTALMLVHYSDLSNREAATVMGISVDAIESLLARGRRTLKVLLSHHKEHMWDG